MQVQPVLQVEDIIQWSSQPPGQLPPPLSRTSADASSGSISGKSNVQTLNLKNPTADLVQENPGIPDAPEVEDDVMLTEEASEQDPGAAGVGEGEAEKAVLLVDCVEAVAKMRERVMQSDVVGFDCEWKPKRDKVWEENEVRIYVSMWSRLQSRLQ